MKTYLSFPNSFLFICLLSVLILNGRSYAQVIRCDFCLDRIAGEYISLNGKNFHPACFRCKSCRKPIESSYVYSLGDFYHPGCLNQENKIICFDCKQAITGEYLKVDGNYYHHGHFFCKKCGKPIEGKYQNYHNDYFHPACFKNEFESRCDYCGNVIDGERMTKENKIYHPECYRKHIMPKCAVCLEPLEGEYKIDIYGNKFHSNHLGVLDQCDICSRIICSSLTNGGIRYGDDRHVCKICYEKAIFTQDEYNSLLTKVIDKLKSSGIDLSKNNIFVHPVDKYDLKKKSGLEKFHQLQGFCNSQERTETVNKKIKKVNFSHDIYILNGLPSINVEAILAHELMHAWTAENSTINHSSDVKEGSCNYISYQYLLGSDDGDIKYLLLNLDKNPDPDYGTGFQKIKKKFYGKPISALLDYLKSGKI